MILVAGKNPLGNVLHIIQGIESELWDDIHGSAAVDVTPILQQMDEDKPVFIHLSRCECEEETTRRIEEELNSGNKYPFAPNTTVFIAPDTEESTLAKAEPTRSGKTMSKPDVSVACSRCLSVTNDLVPGLKPNICYSCVKIDLHIAANIKKDDKDG